MLTVGIDCGLTGAVAFLQDGAYLTVEDMPTVPSNGLIKRRVCGQQLAALLTGGEKQICIESVAARPGQGVSGMFSLGRSLGAVEAVCEALGHNPAYVTPQAWKRRLGLLGTDKRASLNRARELFPDAPLGRLRDHNRAEALLIAHFATLQHPAGGR